MKRKTAVVLLCLVLTLVLTGCVNKEKLKSTLEESKGSSENTNVTAQAEASPTGNTIVVSSMNALPVMLELTQGQPYEATCIGRDAAIEAVHQKTAQLALYDGFSDAETGLQEIIAYASVALITNEQSVLEDVTHEEVRAFFSGETDQIQGVTYERVITAPSTLARSLFEDYFQLQEDSNGMLKSLIPDTSILVESDVQVVEAVAQNPKAIGIIILGSLNDQVKALKFGGVSADQTKVLDGSYPITKPIVVLADPSSETIFQAFLDQIKGEAGQKAIFKSGLVPVIQ